MNSPVPKHGPATLCPSGEDIGRNLSIGNPFFFTCLPSSDRPPNSAIDSTRLHPIWKWEPSEAYKGVVKNKKFQGFVNVIANK